MSNIFIIIYHTTHTHFPFVISWNVSWVLPVHSSHLLIRFRKWWKNELRCKFRKTGNVLSSLISPHKFPLGKKSNFVEQEKYNKKLMDVDQACTTYCPRAKYGPRKFLNWPAQPKIFYIQIVCLRENPVKWMKICLFRPLEIPNMFRPSVH